MQVESRGSSDNLAHVAAHCASCVFLNEISIAKSHTLHNSNATPVSHASHNGHVHAHTQNHGHNQHTHIGQSHQLAPNLHSVGHATTLRPHQQTLAFAGAHQPHQPPPPPPPPPHHLAGATQLNAANNNNNNNNSNGNNNGPNSNSAASNGNQYNLNSSDYSSSTYHIYDQISDLIIIKQQRMERKRQLARRRKLVLLGTLATLLVCCSLYVITRLLASISAASNSFGPTSEQPINGLASFETSAQATASAGQATQRAGQVWPAAIGAPPGGARTSPQVGAARGFDGAHWQQYLTNTSGNTTSQVATDSLPLSVQAASAALCSNRGSVILNARAEPQWPCKCAPGSAGDRCELVVGTNQNSYPSDSNQHAIARCMQHNCSGNGQCNSFGRCQCFAGFVGNECEFRLAAANEPNKCPQNCNGHGVCAPGSSHCRCFAGYAGQACQEILAAVADQCALQQRPCLNGGVCLAWQASCHCRPGFSGAQCEIAAPSTLDDEPSRQQQQQQQQQKQQQMLPADDEQQPAEAQASPGGAGNIAQLLRRQFCSGNGRFEPQSQTCDCDPNFIGPACATPTQADSADPSGAVQVTANKQNPASSVAGASPAQQMQPSGEQQQHQQQQQQKQSKQVASRCAAADTTTTGNNVDSSDNRCGSYGVFECALNKCICQDGFTGDRCQHQHCSAQCLRNGQCVDGVCVCRPGFYGKQCALNGCPNNCSNRGQCVRQAASVVSQPIGAGSESVARATSASSDNAILQAEWRCQCQPGSVGDDCSQLVERQCDDNLDNDNDGLVDCADSECCADKVCQNSTLCMKSPDPLDILMRKQPSPPTSSFFQRMQFLIEKSQTYSNPKDFNDSTMASKYVDRASVIRGRVTYLKQGITGVKVSVAGHLGIGMTLTRDGGYFDLMVNGGGAVLVEFRREPFAVMQRAVRVPWNEIVLMESVELSLESQPETVTLSDTQQSHVHQPTCLAHNYKLMRALISATHSSRPKSHHTPNAASHQLINARHSSHRMRHYNALGAELNQTISLVYISSRANEFMSTLTMRLTPEQVKLVPSELSLVHVKVVVEGNLYEQTFEPQANLTFTYAWNRRNAYRQKSFGLSTAVVSVGYEYFDCQRVVWDKQHVQIAGHDLAISEIGNGWNLNVHHRYNYRDAILQRGDGHNFDLKTSKPRLVQPLMGDGYQRQAICPYCDSGSSSPQEQRLYRPQSLVSAPDGSLYVGDANLVRRIEASERTVRTVLELSPGRTPQRYSLALSPLDQRLYMIDSDRAQVFWIRGASATATAAGAGASSVDVGAVSNQLANDTLTNGEESLLPVIGSGTKCAWSSADADEAEHLANCGDGQLARQAQLIDPKAMAFDTRGKIYLADGPNVREIEPSDGRIHTILGDFGQTAAAAVKSQLQFPCTGEAIPMHKYVPKAPLDLAVNPVDESLHVLDDNVVYRITPDKRVQVVAGQLTHCGPGKGARDVGARLGDPSAVRATDYALQSAQSIAFNQNGELFISEDDQKQALSRVLIVEPSTSSISLFAGLPIDLSGTGSESQPMMAQQAADKLSNMLPRVASSTSSPSLGQLSSGGATLTLGSTAPGVSMVSNGHVNSATRANEHKFSSIEAIAVDPSGNVIVADRVQLRLLSIEPDLPQVNSQGEYELSSPDEPNEVLTFNRFGHHLATREFTTSAHSSGVSNGGSPVQSAQSAHNHMHSHHHNSNVAAAASAIYQSRDLGSAPMQRSAGPSQPSSLVTKYTFTYTVNTSLGQLASVAIGSSGNKISFYRDGPHHQVRSIETDFDGQCKLDVSRNGQVHSSSTFGQNRQPCCTCQPAPLQDSARLVSANAANPLFGQAPGAAARCECVITRS